MKTSEEEHRRLLSEYGQEKTAAAYRELSEWKQNNKRSKWKLSDYLSIRRWVIRALDEREKESRTVRKGYGVVTPGGEYDGIF